MKDLSNRQKNEIECLDYFSMDKNLYGEKSRLLDYTAEISENVDGTSPEEAYFEITDSGEKKVTTTDTARLKQLLDAKKWRLRMMDEYCQGVLEGTTPYQTLLGFEDNKPIPESMMKFMARTMFHGIDKELIESVYYKNL